MIQKNITCVALAVVALAASSGIVLANTVIWSEGFETYNLDAGKAYGSLDKNKAGGANAAPNGSGNAWFGPNPNNAWVTPTMVNPDPTNETVVPHGGQYMIRGSRNDTYNWFSGWDNDIDHINIAYRFNGRQALTNNFVIEWWFYDVLGNRWPGDPNLGPGCFGDHAGIDFAVGWPLDTDYNDATPGDPGTPDNSGITARLAIGAYEQVAGYNVSVYQVQVLGAADAQFGDATAEWGTGWFNTTLTRSAGWHHASISVDANNKAVFSIDDNVVLVHDTGAPEGFNLFTTTELQSTPDTYNQSAYYDDIKLSLITGPAITGTSVIGGKDLKIDGKDGLVGWTYHVVASTDLMKPLNEWASVASSVLSASGNFSIVAPNVVNPGEPRRFFRLRGALVP